MHKFLWITAFVLLVLMLLFLVGANLLARYTAGLFVRSAPLAERIGSVPGDEVGLHPQLVTVAFEPLTLTTQDGLKLYALYYPAQNGAAVILLHGYRSRHSEVIPVAEMLVRHGYGVLLPDLRGHGRSEGTDITFGKLEQYDVAAAYTYLTATAGVAPGRVALFGNSMGSAIAILYAADHPEIPAVVAQSPYNSYEDEIIYQTERFQMPAWLVVPMIRFWAQQEFDFPLDDISPILKISQISPRPIFILQGGQDVMLDVKKAQQLVDADGEPRLYWFDETVGHVDFPYTLPEEFERRLTAFYDQYVK